MRFVAYPTAKDRNARRNGRVLTGDPVSAASPSGEWVYVPDEPPGQRYHRVFGPAAHPAGGEHLKSSIESEAQ